MSAVTLVRLPAGAAVRAGAASVVLRPRAAVVTVVLGLLRFGGDGDGTAALRKQSLFANLDVTKAGRVVQVAEDDSHALSFDSVLTVAPDVRYPRKVVAARA